MKKLEQNETGYRKLNLYAHGLLSEAQLHSLYRLELEGGPHAMNILEIKEALGFDTERLQPGPVSKALFWVRGAIGKFFRWEEADDLIEKETYVKFLSPEDKSRSLVPPGEKEGISRVLYCFGNEFAAEIINRTVHCFWVMASETTESGYALYVAVYVRKLNWFTPFYMALVTPILKLVIYPSLNRSIINSWERFRRSRDWKPLSTAH